MDDLDLLIRLSEEESVNNFYLGYSKAGKKPFSFDIEILTDECPSCGIVSIELFSGVGDTIEEALREAQIKMETFIKENEKCTKNAKP